jgi:hypothetical protein
VSDWREGQACQYDHFVAELDKLLAELDNAEAITEELGAAGMLTETRGYAGGIRALRNDLQNRARELRRHDDITVLPMSLTTRSVRP